MQYRVAVLLRNIRICLYGSEMIMYFNCVPHRLHEYLKYLPTFSSLSLQVPPVPFPSPPESPLQDL
jgi:hypothetical protein